MRKVMSNTHLWMLAGCFALGGLAVQAQAAVWSGNSGSTNNWSDGANWVGGVAPVAGNTQFIQFSGSSPQTTSNVDQSPYTLNALQLGTGGADVTSLSYTVSGGSLTLAGTNPYINNAGGTANPNSPILTINSNLVVSAAATIKPNNNDIVIGGNISNTGNNNLTFSSDSGLHNVTVNGMISGNYNQLNLANGTSMVTTLNGTNQYTSPQTLVFSGTVKLGNSSALGTSSTIVQLNSGAATLAPSVLTSAAVTINRNFFIQSAANSTATGTNTMGGSTADVSAFSGDITLGSTDAGNARGAQPLTVTAATGGTVSFSGNLLQPTANVYAPGAANAKVIKTGLGKVILAGANNTYIGITTVTAGTLQVDGTLTSGGGSVTVNSGATLGGNGIINRAVVVNGDLAPGASIGTLTVDSAGFGTGGKFDVELGAASFSDLLVVTNNLDIANAELVLTGAADGSNYVIATYGSLTGGVFFNVTGLPAGYSIDYGAGTNSQISLVIPEPATLGLMALGGLMIATRRRK